MVGNKWFWFRFSDSHNKVVFFVVLADPLRGNTNLYLYLPPTVNSFSLLTILEFVRNESGRMNSTDLCPCSAAAFSKRLYVHNVRKIWRIVNETSLLRTVS